MIKTRYIMDFALAALFCFASFFAVSNLAEIAEAEKQATAETRAMDSLYVQVFELCNQVQAAGNCKEWIE